jgi:Fe-S cluster biosynthesis and repair protein YggX
VYQLLAECLVKRQRPEDAKTTLKQGYAVAVERGDYMPRDAMAKMLTDLGEAPPAVAVGTTGSAAVGGGFRCQRPGCMWGGRARQLSAPPMKDDFGRRVHEQICADCWNEWLRNFSIKVINELRLDLSTERGQAEYDRHMRDFFGFDDMTL